MWWGVRYPRHRAVALFGGIYYSFVPAEPSAEIPGLIAATPWVT